MGFLNHNYKKFLGYALLIVAFISYQLRHTISIAILNPELIVGIDVLLGIAGIFFAINGEKQTPNKKDQEYESLLKRLRINGERIILNPSNCEVRENNYYEEVVDNGVGTGTVADALYDPNRNVRQNYITQTAIIYYYQTGEQKVRLTSQTFPYSAETLERFLNNDCVILYVDRFNKNEYAFDIEQ